MAWTMNTSVPREGNEKVPRLRFASSIFMQSFSLFLVNPWVLMLIQVFAFARNQPQLRQRSSTAVPSTFTAQALLGSTRFTKSLDHVTSH
jgi:hypothetical protein